MTSLRLLHTLQFLCILAAGNSDMDIAGAFQPLSYSSRSSSSSSSRISSRISSRSSSTKGEFVSGSNNTQNNNKHRIRIPSTLFLSSSSSSMSMQPTANDSGSTMEHTAVASTSPVKVVNAAALIHGPAHAAALEMGNGTEMDIDLSSPITSKESSIHANNNNYYSNSNLHLNSNPTSRNTETEEQLEPLPTTSPEPAPLPTRRAQRSTGTTPKGPVAIAETMEELLAMMDGSDCNCIDENESGTSLTLVLFHAHYCKICQRATMKLTRAAREYPSVNFAKVEARVIPEPASDNLRSLGISKFPFVQIFRKGGCVASFSTGPAHLFMHKVRDTLDLCLERDEDCWEAFTTDFATEIESNRDARRNLQPELLP